MRNQGWQLLAQALLSLMLAAPAGLAQTYTQRGFVETRSTLYPQAARNDAVHATGEALFRYEGFLTASSSLQLSGGVDVRMDTHRQVERKWGLSWQDRELQRPSIAVRRLGVNYHRGGLNVEAGKQLVRWGKTDILNPTDRFAPRDFLAVVDSDFLAIAAARITYERAGNTIDAVLSPRLTPSRVPLANQRWNVLPEGVTVNDAGVDFPGGPQMGFRWNHVGAIEYSASFYEGFNHLPSFMTSIRPGDKPGRVELDVRRFYPRMRMVGGDGAMPLRWLTVKAEAAYFMSPDERVDEYVAYVVQLERQSGEWFFVGGYAGELVTRHAAQPAGFAPDRGLTKTVLGRAGYTIDTNRSLAFEAAVRQSGKGAWTKFEYSQAFGQHWRLTAVTNLIGGASGDFLGQYRRNSHVAGIVRYSF